MPKANSKLDLGLSRRPSSVEAEAPHMQAIMNKAKITPCGGGSVCVSSAGVQLKTQAYIEPSKQDTTSPKANTCPSERIKFDAALRLARTLPPAWTFTDPSLP
mmetsp:Transcript_79965/g.210542  ORF Transcript_79965/g.210542 Transcript_79965/m.210542 type:complete len:103 (+) Transcript_79965:549-857(+)